MKKLLVTTLTLSSLALAQTQPDAAPSPFVDVPPCHWAAGAVAQISSPAAVRPAPTAELAANAVQQVFEGLKCGNPGWANRFISGAPANFAQGVRIGNFALQNVQTQVSGTQATVRFALTLTSDAGTVRRDGTARLTFGDTGWRVDYASLAALNLPVFPR